jgi:hypothetical protein
MESPYLGMTRKYIREFAQNYISQHTPPQNVQYNLPTQYPLLIHGDVIYDNLMQIRTSQDDEREYPYALMAYA